MLSAESIADLDANNLKIVLILTTGFALASILGYAAQRIHFSPLLGYLLAGYMIGPFFPGFTADLLIAEQLAEIGVILMMFGVGLHFKWQDLVKVKNIAIFGAIGQTTVAAATATALIYSIGWPWGSGLIIGLSIGVASTVVLVRVLSDYKLLETPEGHIAVGWLIVEDILTVIALVLLPTLLSIITGSGISIGEITQATFFVLGKFFLLTFFMFTFGKKIVSYILHIIARTRSAELFTLTVLALTFSIATGSALVFGTSIALGAFIAGMVIGQSEVKHQAALHASPMKDAFLVIFFLSVGMIFNPAAISENFFLFLSVLFVILIVKPLTAFIIVLLFKYSYKAALTLALALAQIGEFSFILASAAIKLKILPDEGYDIIVACALISIALNPLLFKFLSFFEIHQEKKSHLELLKKKNEKLKIQKNGIIVGGGIIGQSLIKTFEKIGIHPVIIDRDIDKIASLIKKNHEAIFGDPSIPKILEIAHIKNAQYLILTNLELHEIISTIHVAKKIQPHLLTFVHIKNKADYVELKKLKVDFICCDEEQAILAINSELKKYWEVSLESVLKV